MLVSNQAQALSVDEAWKIDKAWEKSAKKLTLTFSLEKPRLILLYRISEG